MGILSVDLNNVKLGVIDLNRFNIFKAFTKKISRKN